MPSRRTPFGPVTRYPKTVSASASEVVPVLWNPMPKTFGVGGMRLVTPAGDGRGWEDRRVPGRREVRAEQLLELPSLGVVEAAPAPPDARRRDRRQHLAV